MKKLVYITVLVFALAGSAFAQSSFDMGGVEISKGTYDNVDGKFWSNTFALNGDSQGLLYHSTISLDYIDKKSSTYSEISGGNWTLAIFKEGTFAGTIYGDVVGGFITWNLDKREVRVSRHTTVKIRVLGGTGDFSEIGEGRVGGMFTAYSEVASKTPSVRASLELSF